MSPASNIVAMRDLVLSLPVVILCPSSRKDIICLVREKRGCTTC